MFGKHYDARVAKINSEAWQPMIEPRPMRFPEGVRVEFGATPPHDPKQDYPLYVEQRRRQFVSIFGPESPPKDGPAMTAIIWIIAVCTFPLFLACEFFARRMK